MNATGKIIKYQITDVIRSRWLLGHMGFLLIATETLLRFGGDPAKALVSLMNVVLLMIPLIALVFGTLQIYDAREFTALLLAQPIARRELFAGVYLGLTLSLSLGFAMGVGLPFAARMGAGSGATLAALLVVGGRTDVRLRRAGVRHRVPMGRPREGARRRNRNMARRGHRI